MRAEPSAQYLEVTHNTVRFHTKKDLTFALYALQALQQLKFKSRQHERNKSRPHRLALKCETIRLRTTVAAQY
ncbi:hypothetical protein D3C75_1146620 [compost metagenome]